VIESPGDSARSPRDDDFVCCTVRQSQYALRAAEVRLIARVEQMQGGPMDDGRAGTLDIAGQRVPVFALGPWLGGGMSADAVDRARYVVVTGAAGQLAGWLVDRVARPVVSGERLAAPLPPLVGAAATGAFEALLKLGDEAMLLLASEWLNPHAPRARQARPIAAVRQTRGLAPQPEPLVVIFSTPALPPCEAQRYALSGRQMAAVVQPPQVVAVPGSAPCVSGVFWWRRAVVPIVDFRDAGDRDSWPPRRRHIIAQCGGRLGGSLVAFPIDEDIVLHRPDAADQRVPDVARPAFAHGMFAVKGATVALVSLDALLAAAS
jgi:chemotaxis signal transduction protein